uniref:Putative salivary secreted peptide n=1 Tax=Aedes albopictus TaxID=7160 RepID=A0A1W7R7L8_AEDAL
MSEITFVGSLLIVIFFTTVAALECHECPSPAKCNDPAQIKLVQCNDANSQAVYEEISRLFFPTLHEAVLRNGKYQCTSFNLTLFAESAPSTRIKGCMFDTRWDLCRSNVDLPNLAVFGCSWCNSNRCNDDGGGGTGSVGDAGNGGGNGGNNNGDGGGGSAELGWSLLLVLTSLAASALLAA